MKNIMIILLIAAFLIPLSGCVSKTEYESLVEEKSTVDKKIEDFLSNEVKVVKELAGKQKEVNKLKAALAQANAKIKELTNRLSEVKTTIKSIEEKMPAIKLPEQQ